MLRQSAIRRCRWIALGFSAAVLFPGIAVGTCAPRLWSVAEVAGAREFASTLPSDLRNRITHAAGKEATEMPAPLTRLASAGITQLDDTGLRASHRAFRDADRVALLAVAWRLGGNQHWLASARQTLLAWSAVNQPTGHPIDETRLDGFLWGYDLMRCALSLADRTAIEGWFARLRDAKRDWKFGPNTAINNHRTHQLKMLAALQALLEPEHLDDLRASVERHARINLADASGASMDFIERDALHYHVYNLEAWIEIALVTGCCAEPIAQSHAFMLKRMREHGDAIEFERSRAAIDRERAKAGFRYAQPGPYDPKRAEGALIAYATLQVRRGAAKSPIDAWSDARASSLLWRLARLHFWSTSS